MDIERANYDERMNLLKGLISQRDKEISALKVLISKGVCDTTSSWSSASSASSSSSSSSSLSPCPPCICGESNPSVSLEAQRHLNSAERSRLATLEEGPLHGDLAALFSFPGAVKEKVGNVVMYKTHKTGSTTLGSILFRFGARHGRKFMYHSDHYLPVGRDFLKTFERGSNIHLQHHKIRGMGAVDGMDFYAHFIDRPHFITVLRSPIKRYLSAYRYFWEPFHKGRMNAFLLDSRFINQQCRDFGISNSTELSAFLAGPYQRFEVVIINEMFDEGLVMLKRKFNWDMEDILYVRLQDSCTMVHNFGNKPVKCNDPPEAELPTMKEKLKQRNSLDQVLYDTFLAKFKDELAAQDETFATELAHFKQLNIYLADYCRPEFERILNRPNKSKPLPPTFCTKYVIDDVGYEDVIRANMGFGDRIMNPIPATFPDDPPPVFIKPT